MRLRWLTKICLIPILIMVLNQTTANAETTVTGIIATSDGTPIPGACVAPVIIRVGFGTPVLTDSEGRFSINIDNSVKYLLAYHDDPATPGYDYTPAKIMFDYTPAQIILGQKQIKNVTAILYPAASVKFTGQLQYVESEKLATGVTVNILDQKGSILETSGFQLTFLISSSSTRQDTYSVIIPGLDIYSVIIPVGVNWMRVDSTIQVEGKYVNKHLTFQLPESLKQGDAAEYNIRRFSLPANIEYVEGLIQATKMGHTILQSNGFYLAKERSDILTSESELAESKNQYNVTDYDSAYLTLKKAYIGIRQVSQTLQALVTDAGTSIYIILGFLAVSSVIVGSMLIDNTMLKVLGSIIIFTGSAALIYYIYPGARLASSQFFLIISAVAITLSLALSYVSIRIIGWLSGKSRTSVKGILLPIFSIAKRFVKRRKTRFILTATSVTLLVMSFVTLTSISEEYGVTINRVWFSSGSSTGVMVSSNQPTVSEVDGEIVNVWISFLNKDLYELAYFNNLKGVETVSLKYVNRPNGYSNASSAEAKAPIYGVIGINAEDEVKVSEIDEAIQMGTLPGVGEVAISERLSELLKVGVGDTISYVGKNLIVSGILSDDTLRYMKENDNGEYLPSKIEVVGHSQSGKPLIQKFTCNPEEVLILDTSTAETLYNVGLYRITLGVEAGTDVYALAERIAWEMGYRATAASEHGASTYTLGSYLSVKGLPLIIPWGIVVLNVVTTMINSLYERKNEINIMSAVGLNPSHIAGVFISEASIIGFTAGGLGYLLGLSLYRILPMLGFALDVQQKVSAFWSLASVTIALSAVMVGVSVALRSSVVITPSLTRRWRMVFERESGKPFEIEIPLKFEEVLLPEFTEFTRRFLDRLQNDPEKRTSFIRVESSESESVFRFAYRSAFTHAGAFYTSNTLIASVGADGECSVHVLVRGDAYRAYEVGSLVRQLAMEWSNREK